MALAPHEQLTEAIKRCRSAAVILPSPANLDALGSGLALARFIEAKGKPAEVISAGFAPEPHLAFLPGIERVQPTLRASRELTISLPLSGDLRDLRHEVIDGQLKITVTPAEGNIDASGLATSAGEWRHDLAILVCAHELAEIGPLLADHRRFFEETPIFNIDSHPDNRGYGTVNVVDLRASATAELIAGLIENLEPKIMDADTATCLLAGIISETKSFRAPKVTPRTLESAGRLVAAGARREQIVEAIFRTRPIEALRLWGRVLARLKTDRENRLVWSVLSREDFVRAGADEAHLPDVIDELISRTPDAEVICLLHEHPLQADAVCALVSAERGWNALDLAAKWQPTGTSRRAKVTVSGIALPTLEQNFVADIRQNIAALRRR
jgi:nanoRNase/pAp phosphatase (c-di-AMP/oligoRNAs hydrolase)